MPDIETLRSLLARVEAADGVDRELDAEIMFDLFATPVGKHKEDGGPIGYIRLDDQPSLTLGLRFPGKDMDWFNATRKQIKGETLLIQRDSAFVLMNSLRVPGITASIDTVVGLIDRALPGWCWSITSYSLYDGAWVAPDYDDPVHGERLEREFPPAVPDWTEITDVDRRPAGQPALALIESLLKALIAKEEAHVEGE